MKYVSIDTETTGFNPQWSQLIEFGAVIDDLDNIKPLDDLPKFHAYILPPRDEYANLIGRSYQVTYTGEPEALVMNVEILRVIADRKNNKDDRFLHEDELAEAFQKFLKKNGLTDKVYVAGKNFANFDQQFLLPLPGWEEIRFHHRMLDPAMLFMRKGDQEIPNMSLCLERAGLTRDVRHRAVEDATQIVRLVRKGLGYEG